MKRYIILAAVLLTATMWGQAPEKMSYQAVVRDANNQLVTNTNVGMRISILQGSTTGTAVYVETQNPTTNANGLLSIEIGNGTVISGDFSTINWANDTYFIKTETDLNGGNSYTITGTSQLLSVPYALHAKTADSIVNGITETDPIFTAWDKSYTDLTNKPALSDILSHNNDGGAHQIKNIADPTDAQDAVTMSYLDSYTHGESDPDLILWNKLGSEQEVLNSEVGENGELIGTGHTYEPAKFGNGYVRTDVNSYIKFPQTVLANCREKGTIEFWINPKVTHPVAYHYGAMMFVGYGIDGSGTFAFVRWGDGVTGLGISGGINFDGTLHKTPDEAQQFVATIGTPFHIRLVWDVNGIDGSNETIQIYRDGTKIGASTDTWNANATTTFDHFYIGTGPDNQAYDKYIIDNIKVWKTAKTDFSDVNTEGAIGLYTAGDGIDISDNVISLNTVETDPIYTTSQASNITANDIINLSNLSGVNTGDQDISGIAINRQAIQDTASQIRANISGFISTEIDPIFTTWDKSYNDLIDKPAITDSITAVIDTTTQFVRTETQNLSDVLANSNNAEIQKMVNISQLGIGTLTPKSCAIIDMTSSTQGFLPPRMTNVDIYSILNPLEGLSVYSTDEHKPYYYNGTQWVSYDTNTQLPAPPVLSVGDFYAGGVIFYLDATGYHGLVCAVSDQSTSAMWGCFGTGISGADSKAIGSGYQNTIDILNGCSETGTAADICNSAVINGYGDWFLPSLDELNEMKANKAVINATAINNGGTAFVNNVFYWSSSETDNNSAWFTDFNGGYGTGYKSNHQYVRAVRAF